VEQPVNIINDTISKANSVDLLKVINGYGYHLDTFSNKIQCPFPFHKKGGERTSSFVYYPDNHFYCFGCKSVGGPVEFIHYLTGIAKYTAATSLLSNYEVAFQEIVREEHCNELLEFSHLMRDFIISNKDDPASLLYAEEVSLVFDDLREKYSLDKEALAKLINRLRKKIEKYACLS